MMNMNLATKMSDKELSVIYGGAPDVLTASLTGPRYSVGDVVEVKFGVFSWTNRGKITKIKADGSTWMYYIEFYDWFMANDWTWESYIQGKVA